GGQRVFGKRIVLLGPSDGAPRPKLDRDAALARSKQHGAKNTLRPQRSPGFSGEDAFELFSHDLVDEQRIALDDVSPKLFARLGAQHTAYDDFGFAVSGQVPRRRVQNVFRLFDADIDERIALSLAKPFAEDDDVFAVHQHALRSCIANHIRDEIEARFLASDAAIFLVQGVNALEHFFRGRWPRDGR